MKIKHNTYYKDEYDILYTGTKWVYFIAYTYNEELIKYDNRFKWCTIKKFQDFVNISTYNKIEELSKEDLFLELL